MNGYDVDSVSYSNYKYGGKVVLYFHGYWQSGKDANAIKIKDAILDHTDYDHVILIDYEWAVRGINCHRAIANSDYIGRQIGHMTHMLHKYRGLKP